VAKSSIAHCDICTFSAVVHQGRTKAPPATQNASQKSSGTKIRKLGGQSLKLLPSDVIF